ncbi:MAG: hypothetical protein K9H26_15655 [Prolixibacteraceae bacterium]|nr:hypothetical protein [Prolixibacteraceae bacterium]
MKKSVLLSIIFAFFALTLFSQVTVEIIPPPPNELNMETFNRSVVLINEQAEPVPVFLIVTVDEANDGRVVDGTTSVIEAGQGMTYASEEVIEMFRATYHPAYESGFVRTGNAPSGNYTVCVQVIYAETETSLDRKCIRQEVALPHPPVLVFPPDGEKIMEDVPVFTWTPPVPIAATAEVMYKIVVNEILDFQTPEEALKSSPVWFTEDEIYETSFVYPLAAREFEPDKTYVWAVQSLSPDGFPMGENNGWSEVHTFSSMPDNEIDLSLVNLSIPKIELIYPGPGAEVSAEGTQFCWKKLPRNDVTYQVVSETADCIVEEGQEHPFSGLIPSDYRDSLRRMKTDTLNLGRRMRWFTRYCESIEEIKTKARNNIDSIQKMKENLKAVAYTLSGEIDIELSENCPDDIPCCDEFDCSNVDPCDTTVQNAYRDKMICLNDAFSDYLGKYYRSVDNLPQLVSRWHRGYDHRCTMGFYDAYFSLMGDIIGLLPDLINKLSGTAEEAIMDEIRSQLESEAGDAMMAQLDSANRAKVKALLDKGSKAKEAFDAIKGIVSAAKNGGEFPPMLIFEMMKQMYNAAQQATGTAVEGWANFASEMSGKIQQAYAAANCMLQIEQCWETAFVNCDDFCERMKQCVIDDYRERERQIEALYDQIKQERLDRIDYWDEQLSDIKEEVEGAMSNFDPAFMEECCRQMGGDTLRIPGNSECAKQIEAELARVLGDKICYLTFEFTCSITETDSTVETSFRYEHSFPTLERREDCCVDSIINRRVIGRVSGNRDCMPGAADGSGVIPIDEGTRSWRVEARDSDGNLVGESENRPIQRHPTRPARTPPTIVPPANPPKCQCKIDVDINGNGFQNSSTFKANSSVNFLLVTDCGPDCDKVVESLAITYLDDPLNATPPVVFNQGNCNYKFDKTGKYSCVANLVCSDGSNCQKDFEIAIEPEPAKKPAKPSDSDYTADDLVGCGNAFCMHVFWSDVSANKFEQITFNHIEFNQTVELDLQLQSDCFNTGCYKQTDILWEIKRPDGRVDKPQGTDLYDITYNFDQQGVFLICIYQTGSCGGQKITYTKYIKVIVN